MLLGPEGLIGIQSLLGYFDCICIILLVLLLTLTFTKGAIVVWCHNFGSLREILKFQSKFIGLYLVLKLLTTGKLESCILHLFGKAFLSISYQGEILGTNFIVADIIFVQILDHAYDLFTD